MSKNNVQNIRFGCRTDIGRVREHNEDSLLVQEPLFAVADGMGGHAAGEVASEIAIDVLRDNAPKTADAQALADAVATANKEVIRAAVEGRGKEGMGTTMTTAVIYGNKLAIAQVGDSRAYLMHQRNLQQITRDHSLMADLIEQGQITPAEARVHPNRSLITRALGNDPDMFADQYELEVNEGDRLLLCSDGLCGVLTDDEINEILNEYQDPQECADKLVDRANDQGGPDNITAIVVDIADVDVKKKKKKARKTKRTIIIVALIFFLIIGGSAALGFYIVDNSAYLTVENDYIVVYKGVPGSLGSISFSSKQMTSDVNINDLRETTKQHFKDGPIKVDNLDAAYRALENYKQEAKNHKESKDKKDASSSDKDASSKNNDSDKKKS